MIERSSASKLTPHTPKPKPKPKVTISDILENIAGNGREYVVRYTDGEQPRTVIGQIALYDGRFAWIFGEQGELVLAVTQIAFLRRGVLRCRY